MNQAVADALNAWASPVLGFDITLDAVGAQQGTSVGFEMDLFAVDSSHPVFFGNSFFGIAIVETFFASDRPLTNGQSFAGLAISGVDLFFATDRANGLADFFGFTPQERLDALQRLVMHEAGHGLGLGHPNNNNPFGTETNYDTDTDPSNAMVIDPQNPFADLIVSTNPDNTAVMSNRACGEPFAGPCPALFFTSPRNDDIGGRDVLYPIPEPGTLVLVGLGLAVLSARRRTA